MKESELYLRFLKRNIVILLTPILICFVISIYFYSQVKMQTRISQAFLAQYNLQNVDSVLALMDQAVFQLRLQNFDLSYSGSRVSIYKSAPLSITIESYSENKEQAYELLLKESEYLRQNFSVSQLSSPQITLVEPNLLKYLVSALIIGFLIGLIISLTREYFTNF